MGEGLGGRMVCDGVFGEAVGVESEGVGVGCVELQSGGLFLSLSVMLSVPDKSIFICELTNTPVFFKTPMKLIERN